ncbi:uncharacterized protein LOC130949602 [Arachis stenosperma]|uniref:uncharacterized protein LOC130949602 n=1 Tax=Arachis stenosperma TaxID=217475 RepID=UPI0025AD456A|nr:uncharacterized protein LOC130949602 [Arachis stenosperma]
MYLTDASDAIRCKAFPTILTKTAIKWFDTLPPRSITTFDDLAKKFLARFFIQKDKAKHASSLLGIKQGDQESLQSYMERFNKACLDIKSLPTEAAIMGVINGLREGPFTHPISKKHPTFLNEVQERAQKYINMEENSRLGETSKSKFSYSSRDKDKESKKKKDQYGEKPKKYNNYTPLRVSLVDVYREVCKKGGGNQTEYCEYHQIYGHPTNECFDLKNVIEELVREGRLDWYLANKSDEPRKRRRDEEVERGERPPRTPERHVHMINGGFAGGGSLNHLAKGTLKKYIMSREEKDHPRSLLLLSPKKTRQASSWDMTILWSSLSYWPMLTSTAHWWTKEARWISCLNPPSINSVYGRKNSKRIQTACLDYETLQSNRWDTSHYTQPSEKEPDQGH